MEDKSNGYEAIAEHFLAGRGATGIIGAGVVREWARTLPRGASVLDIGCGSGIPVTSVLTQEGLTVSGIDASPAMIAAFRQNFQRSAAECAAIEDATLGNGQYDAAIAWGVLFLLLPDIQRVVIKKISEALPYGGRFLFTAPRQACTWPDAMTGRRCTSLGVERYRELLEVESMFLIGERLDEGENFYYLTLKG